MRKTLIVTAADEGYANLLRELLASLSRCSLQPGIDIACFDVGLAPATREWLIQHVARVLDPEWDLPVCEELRRTMPYLRALTIRPFLPQYLPGYDVYLWIDCDAWVQKKWAIENLLAAAADGSMAAVAENHPAYRRRPAVTVWRGTRALAYFGDDVVPRLQAEYRNMGVFALAADAPHWDVWSRYFARGLDATDGKLCCDQTAINQAIAAEKLPVADLPAHYNWLCHLATPMFDAARSHFCDPLDDEAPLGIIHLTDKTKNTVFKLQGNNHGRWLDLHFPPRMHSGPIPDRS